MVHKWIDSLLKGKRGEEVISYIFEDLIFSSDGRQEDFTLPDQSRMELKTDWTDHPNFCVEIFSNDSTTPSTPGGPWSASKAGSTYYSYLFWNRQELYVFHIPALITYLTTMNGSFHRVKIPQKGGYNTICMLVPIDLLARQECCLINKLELDTTTHRELLPLLLQAA